jgi:nitric oxide dioxygenase
MSNPLSAETIAIVKSTGPLLRKHGLAITQRLYERLLVDPDIAALFDQAAIVSGEQPKRLASAILAYAENIDNLAALSGAVATITRRHAAVGVRADHYAPVAEALLPAIVDVLGKDVATPAVIAAWGEAYWALAEIMIEAERLLLADAA